MKTISVYAYDIATSFDLGKLRPEVATWGKSLTGRSPLILELAGGQFVVVFEYGSVVCFNLTEPECRAWLERLRVFATRANRREFTDSFTLYVGGGRRSLASTKELTVKQLWQDVVLLVATVLSRSVGLEYYEDLIDRNLAKLEEIIEKLRQHGTFTARRRELVKQAGLALSIHHELAYNLQLLDEPDVVWERGAEMQKLYEHLAVQFSITKRSQALERKLEIIARSSEFIIERLQERTANLLELAIILLFVIDLVLIFLLSK